MRRIHADKVSFCSEAFNFHIAKSLEFTRIVWLIFCTLVVLVSLYSVLSLLRVCGDGNLHIGLRIWIFL